MRWRKLGTGSNKAGLLSGKVPWQSKSEAKREDSQNNVNNAARVQQINEQISDALDQSEDNEVAIARRLQWEDDHDDIDYGYRHTIEAAGMDSPADLPPGVTFNGMSAEEYESDLDRIIRTAFMHGHQAALANPFRAPEVLYQIWRDQ